MKRILAAVKSVIMSWETYRYAERTYKESSAVAEEILELKREAAKETHARILELQDQWLQGEVRDLAEFRRRACLIRTDSPTSPLRKDVGVQCMMPPKPRGFYKGKGKDKGKGKGMGDGPEPVWPADPKVETPLSERLGARVEIGPPRIEPPIWDWTGGRSWTDSDTDWKHSDEDWGQSTDSD